MVKTNNTNILSVENLYASYGNKEVLYNVTLSMKSNEIIGLVGPNGAGKSTLLKVIAGQLNLSSGRIFYQGGDIKRYNGSERARMGIGYLIQGGQIFQNMTVKENVEIACVFHRSLKNESETAYKAVLEIFPELKIIWSRRAGLLSGGERQMLAITLILLQHPSLLLLDEPAAGLASDVAWKMLKYVLDYIQKTGTPTLIVEHNTAMVKEISDHVCVMRNGDIVGRIDSHIPDFERQLEQLYFEQNNN